MQKRPDLNDYLEVYRNCKAYHFETDMVLQNSNDIIMGSLDISVTTYCSLNCKGCASLTSLYKERRHQEIKVILSSLKRILQNVNIILRVNILGGEPFLFNELDQLIEFMNEQEKIRRVIIMTNGTVIPQKASLLKALSHPKNEVRISEYVEWSEKQNDLIKVLEKEFVKYSVKRFSKTSFVWYDFGDFLFRGRNEKERQIQYEKCSVEAQYLHNGKLYVCPRAAHGMELGVIPENEDCYCTLNESDERIQDKLIEMIFRTRLYDCCNYCDRGTECVRIIPVAEQIKN